ncbi:MAG: hypothetical protein R2865_15915 [Deinococcales bacterium]
MFEYFDYAATQWQLAGMLKRELGALMNRANILADMGKHLESERLYQDILSKSQDYPYLSVQTLINLAYLP